MSEPLISVPVPETPSTDAAPERSRRSIAIETGIVILAWVVPWTVSAFCEMVALQDPVLGMDPDPSATILTLLPNAAMDIGIISFLLYFIWRSGEPWVNFGMSRPRWVPDIARTLGILTVLWAEGGFFRPRLEFSRPLTDYLVLAIASLASGIAQEMLFRGYLIPRFEKLLKSSWWSLLLSSALFSGIHAYQGILRVPETFFWGLICGAFFLWLRRVWPLAIAHAVLLFILDTADWSRFLP